MRNPLGLAAVALAAGALASTVWDGAALDVLASACALALAAAVGRRTPLAPGLWLAAVFALGLASAVPVARPAPERDAVRGEVVAAAGREAVLRTAQGHVTVRFAGEPPVVGQRILALTRPADAGALLPGAWDGALADRLGGRALLRASAWLPLGAELGDGPRFVGARHAGLLRALVTGQRDMLPEEEGLLLQRTGTTHLLSISGLHVGGMAALAGALASMLLAPLAFGPWPRLRGALSGLAALAAAAAYAGAVGWPVPALRSAYMVGAAVVGRALGRSGSAWSALGLAAIAVVLWDPSQVAEASALLSFGAVAGILWVGPRFTRYLPPDAPRPLRWVVTALATSLGATAGTLPVCAWLFQSLPPLSPVANLVAAPLIGGLATPLALLGGFGPAPVAGLAVELADQLCALGLWILRPLATTPWPVAVGPLGAAALALALPLRRQTGIVALLVLLALGLRVVPTGGLSVIFLNVGQGDSAALRWPDGEVWLIDGGPPSGAVLAWLRREGVSTVEAIFLSHPDMDHLGGLISVVEGLSVERLWVPREARDDEPEYAAFLKSSRERGVVVLGPRDPAPRQARLWAPDARSDNDRGLVLRVDYGERSLLFTGDVEAEGEAWLRGHLGSVDVVKVPHHGSRTSSSEGLVTATRPRLAVISVGRGNPFGHPAPEVVARWAHARVLRTDLDGTITLWTDGEALRGRAFRPEDGWRELALPVGPIAH